MKKFLWMEEIKIKNKFSREAFLKSLVRVPLFALSNRIQSFLKLLNSWFMFHSTFECFEVQTSGLSSAFESLKASCPEAKFEK